MLRAALFALLTTGLCACPATPPPVQELPAPAPEPEPEPAPEASAGLADGAPCTDGAECASGICEGEGCEAGTCSPALRPCTRDLRPYCGRDGETFRTSGSCPGRLYAHAGECPPVAETPPAGP